MFVGVQLFLAKATWIAVKSLVTTTYVTNVHKKFYFVQLENEQLFSKCLKDEMQFNYRFKFGYLLTDQYLIK